MGHTAIIPSTMAGGNADIGAPVSNGANKIPTRRLFGGVLVVWNLFEICDLYFLSEA
jgi:hypothetical protein